MGVWAWLLLGPVVPVALAEVVMASRPGKIGAAAVLGAGQAGLLAWAAADDDPTAVAFALGLDPIYACLAVVPIAVAERVVLAWVRPPSRPALASVGNRLAALLVDIGVVGAASWWTAERWDGAVQLVVPAAIGYGGLAIGCATGGTIGHRLVRLRVVDRRTGQRLPPGRALLRALVVFVELAATVLFVGAFVVAFDLALTADAERRSIGDRAAGSCVVRHVEPG